MRELITSFYCNLISQSSFDSTINNNYTSQEYHDNKMRELRDEFISHFFHSTSSSSSWLTNCCKIEMNDINSTYQPSSNSDHQQFTNLFSLHSSLGKGSYFKG